jgi:hypothetical protein
MKYVEILNLSCENSPKEGVWMIKGIKIYLQNPHKSRLKTLHFGI